MYKDIEILILMQLSYLDIDFIEGSDIGTTLFRSSINNQGKIQPIIDYINRLEDNASLFDLTIKKYLNENPPHGNGFVGYVLENKKNKDIIFLFRGSENIGQLDHSQIDMVDNVVSAVTGDSNQIESAKQFFLENMGQTNYLLGHSKGGNLAAEVFISYDNQIKKVITINGQPVNRTNITSYQKALLNSNQHECIVASGDIVSWLGVKSWQQKKRFVKVDTEGASMFSPHDLLNIVIDQDGDFVDEKWPYIANIIDLILNEVSFDRFQLEL